MFLRWITIGTSDKRGYYLQKNKAVKCGQKCQLQFDGRRGFALICLIFLLRTGFTSGWKLKFDDVLHLAFAFFWCRTEAMDWKM